MTNAATSTQEQIALAEAVHDVKITSMVKTLTAQRENAQNALVNALGDKAVAEYKLQEALKNISALSNALAQKNQENAELRILVLNLQQQVSELKNPRPAELTAPAETPVAPEVAEVEAPYEEASVSSEGHPFREEQAETQEKEKGMFTKVGEVIKSAIHR
jgi:hypothetical protein